MTKDFNIKRRVPQSRMQKRSRQTRDRLVQAALRMFCEKGTEATTIEDVTETADLGKGTFYRHFAGKADVIVALVERSVGQLIGEIRGSLAGCNDLQEVLAGLLRAHTRFFVEYRSEFTLLFQGRLMLNLEREDPEGLEKPFLDYLDEIQAHVAPFMASPADGLRVRRVACALAGFVSGFLSFALIGLAEEEIEASLGPLRKAFVTGCSAFLTATSRPAEAASAPPELRHTNTRSNEVR